MEFGFVFCVVGVVLQLQGFYIVFHSYHLPVSISLITGGILGFYMEFFNLHVPIGVYRDGSFHGIYSYHLSIFSFWFLMTSEFVLACISSFSKYLFGFLGS